MRDFLLIPNMNAALRMETPDANNLNKMGLTRLFFW